jgi:hypothetical protein
MRFLMKVSIPVEPGNKAVREGTLAKTMRRALDELKPEAAYFAEIDGHRTAFIVVDMQGPHQMPFFAEPWFLAFNASVEFHPAMTAEDLEKAGPDLERAAKTYG